MPNEAGNESNKPDDLGPKPWTLGWNSIVKGVEGAVEALSPKKAQQKAVEGGLKPWEMDWAGRGATRKQTAPTGFNLEDYRAKLEEVESKGNPEAQAKTSTATGLHQFTAGTWLDTVRKLGKDYTLEDRKDPKKSREVFDEFTKQKLEQARSELGREPTQADVYMYHLLGKAKNILNAPRSDDAVDYVGKRAVNANRNLFYKSDGSPKTVGEVLAKFEAKFGKTSEPKKEE